MDNNRKIVKSQAPVRILDIGGWTDTWFVGSGKVLNMAIDKYTHASVREIEGKTRLLTSITYNDGTTSSGKFERPFTFGDKFDLIKAVVQEYGKRNIGYDVILKLDYPIASGLGSSASILMAVAKCFAPYPSIEHIHQIEEGLLGREVGLQDYYPALHGGINTISVSCYPRSSGHKVQTKLFKELSKRLSVVIFSERDSSDRHRKVLVNYIESPTVREAIEELKTLPKYAEYFIKKGDFELLGKVIRKNNCIFNFITNNSGYNKITPIVRISENYKVLGYKQNGAGGGSMTFLLKNTVEKLAFETELKRNGYTVLDFNLLN